MKLGKSEEDWDRIFQKKKRKMIEILKKIINYK